MKNPWRILFLVSFALPLFFQNGGLSQAVCAETAGRTERNEYRAAQIQTTIYYTVYLPPCYDHTTADYPVIYLMHGSNDDDGQWLRLGLGEALDTGILSGEIPPVIVVMPGGNWIANENEFGGDGTTWDDIFLRGIMPLAESQYRVRANRNYRAIGGISRGGFWAYQIGLRHPILFGAVGGHSAFFDLYHAPDAYNPLDLALTAPGLDRMRLWLDRGRDDYAAPGLDIMGERLAQRGLAHTYMIYPEGQHYFTYWAAHIPDYVAFYTAPWQAEMQLASASASPSSSTEAIPETTVTPAIPAEQTIVAQSTGGEASLLFVPAVAFTSLQANIARDRLERVRAGQPDPALIVSQEAAAALAAEGVLLAPETEIVPAESLLNTLWRFGEKYTLLPFDQLTTRYRVLLVDEAHPVDLVETDYPFAFASASPNYAPDRLTRILLSGVTALTRDMIPVLDANGVEWAAEAIAPYTQQADFFHISNEVSFDPACPQMRPDVLGGPTSFCSRAEHFALFTLLGVDIVELTGNHNNDYGYEAYADTYNWFTDNGMRTVGGGMTPEQARQPLLIEHNGNRVAIIACNWAGPYYALANDNPDLLGGVRPGAADCSQREWLMSAIQQAKTDAYIVIVTVQHVEADQYVPLDDHRIQFQQIADWGADVVAGTASHFPQIYEFYGETFIHYGLGNFLFDQEFFAGMRFLMDTLYVYDGRLLTVDVFTGLIEGQGRPRPMTPDEREVLLYLLFREHGGF